MPVKVHGSYPMNELLSFFLSFSTTLKLFHWHTRSYSRHVASDELHEEFQKLSDKFVEIYMGRYGRPALPCPKLKFGVRVLTDVEILEFVKRGEAFLVGRLPHLIDRARDPDLLNLRDEILGLLRRGSYLLSFSDVGSARGSE
jgi:hypothetical protein